MPEPIPSRTEGSGDEPLEGTETIPVEVNVSEAGSNAIPPLPSKRGARILFASVMVVTAFAIAGLLGLIPPVVGAAVGLGAQVVGTVAFFLTYYLRSED